MASYGPPWPLIAFYGTFMALRMAPFGPFWRLMAPLWLVMAPYGLLLPLMAPYGRCPGHQKFDTSLIQAIIDMRRCQLANLPSLIMPLKAL